jgi:hypothetical protein
MSGDMLLKQVVLALVLHLLASSKARQAATWLDEAAAHFQATTACSPKIASKMSRVRT